MYFNPGPITTIRSVWSMGFCQHGAYQQQHLGIPYAVWKAAMTCLDSNITNTIDRKHKLYHCVPKVLFDVKASKKRKSSKQRTFSV